VKIRVEGKEHEIASIELSGEWRVEPVAAWSGPP